ncbi:hypothetical protein PIB30_079206, partial [Stylosanthes scabra]|nr:hypothetical protein [Stylosanthes scabra]
MHKLIPSRLSHTHVTFGVPSPKREQPLLPIHTPIIPTPRLCHFLIPHQRYLIPQHDLIPQTQAIEKAEEEEENRGTKEAWNYNNLIIGTLNTKPKDVKNTLECQKTTPRHGKTKGKLHLNMVLSWTCCQHDLSAL